MIEVLSSKRMTIVIVILILVCTIVIIIEEWYTNSQLVVSSAPPHDTVPLQQQQPPEPLPSNYNDLRDLLHFLSIVTFLGSTSGLLVKYRQHQLGIKTLARFRKHTDSEDSSHTLINMNHTS